jgi:hypothetical protein
MDIVPRMGRNYRRNLLRLGRESGNPATALRFHAAARIGLGKSSSELAEELGPRAFDGGANGASLRGGGKRRSLRQASLQRQTQGRRRLPVPPRLASSANSGALRVASADVDARAVAPAHAARWPAGRRGLHHRPSLGAHRRATRLAEADRALPVAARKAGARPRRAARARKERSRAEDCCAPQRAEEEGEGRERREDGQRFGEDAHWLSIARRYPGLSTKPD